MKLNTDQYKEVYELLVKYLTGEASVDERESARKWINENPSHQKFFREIQYIYQITKTVQRPSGFDKQAGWARVKDGFYKNSSNNKIVRKKSLKKRIVNIWLPIAASVIIAFLIGTYIDNKFSELLPFKSTAVVYNEIIVPLGAKSQIVLSDGTKVWLNAGSKLKYPSQFIGNTREVYLEGEAFFDVTHIKNKTFIVRTLELNIKVHGTQFNVKSYPEDNLVETTLVKGSVEVEKVGKSNQRVFLKPNQTATFYKKDIDTVRVKSKQIVKIQKDSTDITSNILITSKTNNLATVTWKDPNWVIDGEELGILSKELERRYNVRIVFEDKNLMKYKFTGNLMNVPFEQVLKIIQLSAPINYTVDNDIVVFKEDKQYKLKYDKMIQHH